MEEYRYYTVKLGSKFLSEKLKMGDNMKRSWKEINS